MYTKLCTRVVESKVMGQYNFVLCVHHTPLKEVKIKCRLSYIS